MQLSRSELRAIPVGVRRAERIHVALERQYNREHIVEVHDGVDVSGFNVCNSHMRRVARRNRSGRYDLAALERLDVRHRVVDVRRALRAPSLGSVE